MPKRIKTTKPTGGTWLNISGRTFELKSPRDVTAREMIELGLPPERAPEYVAGRAPGIDGISIYERKYVRPPRSPIPILSHKRLWALGSEYADFSAPHIVAQARETGYPLPVRRPSELFPVLKDVYELLEKNHGIPWDNLLASQQDDFMTGFWNRLRERRVAENVIEGARRYS